MNNFGWGFLVGVVTVVVALILWSLLKMSKISQPPIPGPTLTPEEKERIREEITSDSNVDLARRLLERLRDAASRRGSR